jgi:hypothetical protein
MPAKVEPIDHVFILGAGASATTGAPLMRNFLSVSDDLLRQGSFKEDSEEIDSVFQLKAKLGGVYRSSYLDINNIESLFGAIEMGGTIQMLAGLSVADIKAARSALVKMIVRTLELKMDFPYSVNSLYSSPGDYGSFANMISKYYKNSCVITFNYDLGVDVALTNERLDPNYCLDSLNEKGYKLLKLHGSVNWAKTVDTGNIIPLPISYLVHSLKRQADYNYQDAAITGRGFNTTLQIPASQFLKSDIFNNYVSAIKPNSSIKIEDIPVIVPPTWNKSGYHGTLSNVWSTAAKAISSARHIHVIGYSLPESDSFFRYLFALSTLENASIREFSVYDISPANSPIYQRYNSLLGEGIKEYFNYYSSTFEKAIRDMMQRANK